MTFLRSLALFLSLSSVAVARDMAAQAEGNQRPTIRGTTPKRNPLSQPQHGMQMRQEQEPTMAATPQAAAAAVVRSQNRKDSGFDFIVAGFPRCGTTTLLKTFAAHDETDIAKKEQCVVAAPNQVDSRVLKRLDDTLATLSSEPSVKRSIKCPTTMYNYNSIDRLEKHSPNVKYIIGMRHPVEMMQSFYNYRVTEIKDRSLDEPIPSFEDVLASGNPWKGVSMQSSRFELFLMQMGKTKLAAEDFDDLAKQNFELAIQPTKAKVFLYTVDQLEDNDEKRVEAFRAEMQSFLGLTKPIQAFGHENKNHQVHDESIDICDAKWAAVRAQLVQQGTTTARWLLEKFILSEDVVVANFEHFAKTLESWSTDPCAATASS